MNHIYRRIWNKAKQCWVVGSELSSRCGRSSAVSRNSASMVMLLASVVPCVAVANGSSEQSDEQSEFSMLTLNAPLEERLVSVASQFPLVTYASPVMPFDVRAFGYYTQVALVSDSNSNYNDSKINGQELVLLGANSSLRGNRSVGYGNWIEATGDKNTVMGYDVKASGGYGTAIGAASKVSGIGATALGHNARATQVNAVAIGSGSSSSSSNAIALGANSVADSSYTVSVGNSTTKRRIVNVAAGSTSYGSSDAVTGGQLYETNQAVSSVRNTANSAYSTASTAQTTANSARTNADSALSKANTLGGLLSQTSTSGNVRLGGSNSGTVLDVRNSTSANRRITGVADATLSTTSAEAVSGKQLNTTNSNVTAARSVADSAKTNADSALSKANTLSGLLSQTSASGNVRVGGSNSGTILDVRNSANANRKITGVADATISATSTEAVSGKQLNATNSNVTAARSVADIAKTNADSALTKANTLSGLLSQASASGNVRLGATNSGTLMDVRNSANASRKITGVADATLSATSTDAVTGRQLNATNSNVSTALSDASAAKISANTALTQVGTLNGLLSQASASGNVRVGEKNSGTALDVRNSANANRRLTGVADGVVSASSYEAVNGRQLNATNDKVATVEGIARSAGTEAAAAKTDAANALTETAALGGLVAQISATGNMRLGEKNSGTVLDVRNSTNESRKISGVADGLVSGDSAEAISGRQLHETNSRVSNLEISGQFLSIGTAPIIERAEAGLAGVALGNAAKAGADGGTAVGTRAIAMGRNSVAVGRGSTVFEGSDNGFALGAGAEVGSIGGAANGSVALGAGAKVASGADSSLALGQGAEAREGGVASFGNAILQRRLVNIARGTADHNATTVAQLKDSLATLGGSAGMDGNGSIIAPTYTVQGGTQNTVEDALTALDGAVITADRRADKVEGQLSSIFQDSPSVRADGMNQIALNGVNGMVLTNLADGRVAPGSRDAVTGNQLYAAEQKISQNRSDLEAMRKEREMGQQAMRGLDASVIDYGGARLTGVAEAKLSADSSDVVRGSQLYETNEKLQKLSASSRFVAVGDQGPGQAAKAGPVGVAIGDSAEASLLSEGAVAIGSYAKAAGKNSVALGRAAYVDAMAVNGFAIGVLSSVHEENGIAIGVGSVVKQGASSSVAIGVHSVAEEAGTVAFGNGEMKRRLVSIANGTANHNAATIGQLRGALSALGGEVDANGNIVGPRFNVLGQTQSTLNGALEALDGAVVTNTSRVDKVETQLRSVFQDTPSVRADGVNQLTLAGANGMVISNVANGVIAAGSRDAVNGGQLHSMQQQLNGRMDGLEQRIDDAPAARALASSSVPKPQAEETPVVPDGKDSHQVASVGEGDKPAPQPKANKDDSPKPQVDTAELEKMLARANEYTDGAISNFERRLDKMDKRFNRMAAMSSAQTAMAMNTAGLATYNRLGAGVGYSEGESAMAVGYQRVLNEKGSATFSLNGAFTNSGERSMGVGVGIGW